MVFAAIFAISTAYLAYDGSIFWMASGVLTIIFAVAGLSNAAWLTSLNRLWMKFGLLLGMIVAPVALGVLFFVVITPLGILARAFGNDFLRIKPDTTKSSYWVDREPPGPDAASMHRQF
jgi:hypothetical protein